MDGGPFGIPSLAELAQYNVNRPDQVEAIKSSLYDTVAYPTAGQTQLQFFQVPKGQSSKTFADTNMTNAGMLPAPQSFLVQSIELIFLPAEASIAGNGALTTSDDFILDVYSFAKAGWLEFFIGSKPYLDEAPLIKFPPKNGLSGWAALAQNTSTAATAAVSFVSYASVGGPVYELNPPILLVPTQNFVVTLNWPSAVTLVNAARVVCNLGGILYRNSQ